MPEKLQACFVNSENPPISSSHLAWFVKEDPVDNDYLLLCEVVLEKYPHPDAPKDAVIDLTNYHVFKRYKKTDHRASPLIVFKAMQETCCKVFGQSPNLKGELERV